MFFWFEIYKDEKKLRHNKIIKNWSVNIWESKTLKFKVWNISFVLSFWNNSGAMITVDPLKKYKHSGIQYFFLKEKPYLLYQSGMRRQLEIIAEWY